MANQLHTEFRAKLMQLGIPAHDVKAFGTIRTNVHVLCIGRDTATRWVHALHQVFPGASVATSATSWEASINRGTCLRPTKVQGFFVSVSA
jgi:hypothetical protein